MKISYSYLFQLIAITLFIPFIACSQTKQADKSVEFKSIYPFKPVSSSPLSKHLKDELFVPYYKEGRYYMSDYNGNITTPSSWDQIYFSGGPYFWGEENGYCRLYRVPNILIIEHPIRTTDIIDHELFKQVFPNDPSSDAIMIGIDTTIILPNPNTVKLDTISSKVYYFFNSKQDRSLTDFYLLPSESPFNLKKVKGEDQLRKYKVVITKERKYQILDSAGKPRFNQGFYSLQQVSDQFVIVSNEHKKKGLGFLPSGKVSEYVFDTIKTIYQCDSTFNGGILSPNGIHWYLIDYNGEYKSIPTYLSNCDSLETPSIEKKEKYLVFSDNTKVDDNRVGLKDSLDKTILPAEYKYIHIIPKVGWAAVRQKDQFGLYHLDGHWIYPLADRKLYVTIYSDSTASITVEDSGQKFIFNEQMELINESPPLFFPDNYFDWHSVPPNLKSTSLDYRRPLLYQPYLVFMNGDNKYGHVFTSTGKYISSHSGLYDENVSLLGIPHDPSIFGNLFIPVGSFKENGIKYYVRLTDGFEYRNK